MNETWSQKKLENFSQKVQKLNICILYLVHLSVSNIVKKFKPIKQIFICIWFFTYVYMFELRLKYCYPYCR